LETVLVGSLRGGQRRIGGSQQGLDRTGVLGVDRDANARANGRLIGTPTSKWLVQRADHTQRHQCGGVRVLHLRQHDSEFVATESRQRAAAANTALETLRDLLEHDIARTPIRHQNG